MPASLLLQHRQSGKGGKGSGRARENEGNGDLGGAGRGSPGGSYGVLVEVVEHMSITWHRYGYATFVWAIRLPGGQCVPLNGYAEGM